VRLSRRDLLKVLQVGGLGAAAAGAGLLGFQGRARATVQGVCRLCTMHCGVVATVENGHLVRVEGDPTSKTRGFVCLHGHSTPEVVHSPDRVKRPLKRVGDSFVEVGWDQALAEIAERMNRIKAQHGARAVAVQTGWPFVRHPLVPFLHRFCRAFGTPNLATVASLCESSGRMGRALTVGLNVMPDVGRARTLFVWGGNPWVTAPPFTHMVANAANRERHLVVIDPVRTELAALASLHLQLRPGTDGALAMGMLRIILANGWHDRAFVDEHCLGLEALRKSADEWPEERVERVTGVPARDFTQAARWFAQDGPTSVWEGLGVEHHTAGVQMVRAITCLEAVCGHLDVAGGGQLQQPPGPRGGSPFLPAQWRMNTPEPVPPPLDVTPVGYAEYPLFEAINRQAQANLFADAILDDKPYPLRGLILVASNALVTGPDSGRMKEAVHKLDLLVSVDPFLNTSGEMADYVLPSTTFAEAPVVRGNDDGVGANSLVAPQHEARPDWRIIFDLAGALGLGRYFPWTTFQEAMAAPRVPFMEDPAHELRPLAERAPSPRFPTASGKVELQSTLMARFGLEDVPRFDDPPPTTEQFPLTLVTGPRTKVFINSQFHAIPPVASKLRVPQAQIHAATAAPLGIKDGDSVVVSTEKSEVRMTAHVHEGLARDVVVVPGGWARANANLLTTTKNLDPVSGFPAFRSLRCRVRPG
jgi:anaerobic selenocysteine-containing dehydrogenase